MWRVPECGAPALGRARDPCLRLDGTRQSNEDRANHLKKLEFRLDKDLVQPVELAGSPRRFEPGTWPTSRPEHARESSRRAGLFRPADGHEGRGAQRGTK